MTITIGEFTEKYYDDCVAWAHDCLATGHKDHAEDMVHETFANLLEKGVLELRSDTAKTYVFKAILNTCLSLMSKDSRRAELAEQNEEKIEQLCRAKETHLDPAAELSAQRALTAKLQYLTPLLRQTFVDLVYEGYTPEELAKKQDVKPNVIYQRLHQLKKQLGDLN